MAEAGAKKIDRYIPWMIVGFFLVVAFFDGIFVYLATSTHTGVVTDHAYQRGLDYNDTVAAANKQENLGWETSLDLVANSTLMLSLKDDSAAPINGARVYAEVMRPTQDGFDFEVPLEPSGAGEYSAPVDFPMVGQWDVRVFVEWKQEQYQLNKRLVVKP